MTSKPAGQPEAASRTWVLAFRLYLIVLNLLLLSVLFRL
jgi:hypothetical protein